MSHLLTPEGLQALSHSLQHRPLLALDFDGTLAPIVAEPGQARASEAIARTLSVITRHLPVAIITGRAIADVADRLGFTPHYIIGNHGAEGLPGSIQPDLAQWRSVIFEQHHSQLASSGVHIEDKGHSFSLHYRQASDAAQAHQAIAQTIATLKPTPRVIGGKCVTNLLPPDAPDKFQAIVALLAQTNCQTVIFAGDDVTDDVVFEQAPANWLTVRIERIEPEQARFYLNTQNEVALFLNQLLALLDKTLPSTKEIS